MNAQDDVDFEKRQRLKELPNVHGTGIGFKKVDGEKTDTEAVIVFVTTKEEKEELEESDLVPETLDGYPTDVQQRDKYSAESGPGRRLYHRPVMGGQSVGHVDTTAGSSSALLFDEDDDPVLLTNRHIATGNVYDDTVGDPFLSPGPMDHFADEQIGTVKELAPLSNQSGVENETDSAIIDVSLAYSENNVSAKMLGAGLIAEPETPEFGVRYVNNGRTTGLTSTEVEAMDVETYVSYDAGSAYMVGMVTFEADNITDGGDSGSIYFRVSDNGQCHPVALNFAGGENSSVAIPWDTIEQYHGQLRPGDYNEAPTGSAHDTYFEATPIRKTTGNKGVVDVLIANTGGKTGIQDVELINNGNVLDTQSPELEFADYSIEQFDISSLSNGTHDITIQTPNESRTVNLEVAVQTSFKISISVYNESFDPIEGASVNLDSDERFTDSNGVVEFWRDEGSYTYNIQAPDYDDVTNTVNVNSSNIDESHTLTFNGSDTNTDEPTTPVDGVRRISWSESIDWNEPSDARGLTGQFFPDYRISDALRQNFAVQTDLFSSCRGFWPLGEADNRNVFDVIGDNDGDANNVSRNQWSFLGARGYRFENDSYVEIPSNDSLVFSGSFSVTALIHQLNESTVQAIFRNGYNEPGITFFDVRDNGRVSFGFYDDGGSAIYSSDFHVNQVNTDDTHHITGVYDEDAGELRVYHGTNVDTVSVSATRPEPSTNTNYSIGQRIQNDDRQFDGYISNVAMFDKALSAEEVSELAAATKTAEITLSGRTL